MADESTPELKYETLKQSDLDERKSTAELVTNILSERRTRCNVYIFKHPYFISGFIPLMSIFLYTYKDHFRDQLGSMILFSSGVTMAYLLLWSRSSEYFDTQTKLWAESNKDASFPDSNVIVAKYGDRIIGAISLSEKSKNSALINFWVVLRPYRNAGLGKDLLKLALDSMKQNEVNSVSLSIISPLEQPAEHILRKNGFASTLTSNLPSKVLTAIGIRNVEMSCKLN
ncbi:hypothetical protein CANCADRAFT_58193 [Tortispora caseinolytica NRRL Y-17796]|uniref:N-acetyltransferase domain-containing protein n=1 Tax=Tortispora caseinolytica NRRL Y-17796 TaxID=767744 RepID=A0A1E4TBR9_9ASCO|nr:hypothetical protein CANCADRAFT_58193 [Tortispora caseinolytica NRRL Y-17796]